MHPSNTGQYIVDLKNIVVTEGSVSLVDEQWAIKLPQFRALESVHLFIEALSLGEETLIIHASVGRHRRYSFF